MKISQRLVAIFCALAMALQTGCANISQGLSQPVVSNPQDFPVLGKIAVVASPNLPEIKFEGFSHNKKEGAIKGFEGAFGTCANPLAGGCAGGGEACVAIIVIWAGVCSVFGAAGALAGAVSSPNTADVVVSEASASTAIDITIIQKSLRDQVLVAAIANNTSFVSVSPKAAQAAVELHDYRLLSSEGAVAVLEVALTKIETVSKVVNTPQQLRMKAHARLIRTSDNSEYYSHDYDYFSKDNLKLDEWTANHAERLLHSLQLGYKSLGNDIYDNVDYIFQDQKAKVGCDSENSSMTACK